MEALARNALGDDMAMPANIDQVMEQDELRVWFEREIGSSE
jgi:hypothetical protein